VEYIVDREAPQQENCKFIRTQTRFVEFPKSSKALFELDVGSSFEFQFNLNNPEDVDHLYFVAFNGDG